MYTLILPLIFEAGCHKKRSLQSQAGLKVKFEVKSIQKTLGDCGAADSECAQVDMTFPFVKDGVPHLMDAINDSLYKVLIQNLVFETFDGLPNEASLLAVADSFLLEWQRASQAGEGGVAGGWELTVTGEVGLHTPKVAVVSLGTYSYAGGAHPSSYTVFFNFDLKTGRALTWPDLVSDTSALAVIAEKKFKQARELPSDADLILEGFFWEGKFTLPKNFELQEEGIYFWYNPYEAASYAQGPTDFLITYEELGSLFRKNQVF